MTDAQFELAISILFDIQNDIDAVKLSIAGVSASIDRMLAMPLPSGSNHA